MLPRWQSDAERWPISMSAFGLRSSRIAAKKVAMVRQAHARRSRPADIDCVLSARTASSRRSCPAAACPRCRRRRCRFRTFPGDSGDQIALLEDELPAMARPCRRPGYSNDDILRVGELLIVVEEVLAAEAEITDGCVSTPSPQRAMSMSWTPSLPMSPVPKSYHQCQP